MNFLRSLIFRSNGLSVFVSFILLLLLLSLREGKPAPPAGQRHAGRQRPVPADGGDGEAGGAKGAPGGEGALLLIYQPASARRGERHFPIKDGISLTAATQGFTFKHRKIRNVQFL